jgi:orotate phosphoribosyltransferase
MDHTQRAVQLYTTCHLSGSFVLRSGDVISEYFDKYRFESDPRLLGEICNHLRPLLPLSAELLAAPEVGAIPLGTVLSLATGLPVAFVHKQRKPYGTRRLVEGCEVSGRRVAIVDDVLSSGAQMEEVAAALVGARIAGAVCVIDREHAGRERLARLGCGVSALFTEVELRIAAAEAVADRAWR